MSSSVWYAPRTGRIGFIATGALIAALGIAPLTSPVNPGTVTIATGFFLGGLWTIVRGPRTAVGANSSGFAQHTSLRSRFIPWCHVTDLRVDVLDAEKIGTKTFGVRAELHDGRKIDLSGTWGHRLTQARRARMDQQYKELYALRASHACTGRCAPATWYVRHTPPQATGA
ncbi:hypothetical protein [Yinghuangia sp. YIM S09857]|uniref:hypothetical protein n=1 Tax=Yinghuangia sp. YIM S09857 TaxID=3436929 RepID=UPI003F53DB0C